MKCADEEPASRIEPVVELAQRLFDLDRIEQMKYTGRVDRGEVGHFEVDVRQLAEADPQPPAMLGRNTLDEPM
jgi:hypothetical protein